MGRRATRLLGYFAIRLIKQNDRTTGLVPAATARAAEVNATCCCV